MPIIVPEENHENIAGLTGARFRAADYGGSGLEVLGAGMAKLGDGGAEFAAALDEQRKRIATAHLGDGHQRNIDDAAVKKTYVDYSDKVHAALHGDDGLVQRRGVGAHEAFPELVGRLADIHDEVLAPLDDVQRAAIAPVLGKRMRSDVEKAADHVREQGKAGQQEQVEKLLQATTRDAVLHLGDPDLHEHFMATGENSIARQGRMKGLSDKEIGQQVSDYTSAVHAATIDTLTGTDPVHAAGWYARYGDKLNDIDKQRIEVKLRPALADARAVADVDAASAGDAATAPTKP